MPLRSIAASAHLASGNNSASISLFASAFLKRATPASSQIAKMHQETMAATSAPARRNSSSVAGPIQRSADSGFWVTVGDRVDKRRLIAKATGALALMALVVGILANTGAITLWHVIVISLLSAAAAAFFQPATQALLYDIVGPDRLFRAVSLNSSAMNLGGMIGPAAGGILIAMFGIGASFYLIAVMFLGAMLGILAIRSGGNVPVKAATPILKDAAEALAYVRRTPHVAWLLLLSTATLFAAVYFPLVPVYARDVFGGGAREFGFLMGAQGAGFLIGSLATTQSVA